jgi:hypothetical protein
MLFWTVVLFVTYSLIYFVISQKKIRRLQNSNVKLSMSLNEKSHLHGGSRTHTGPYKHQLAN